MKNKKKITSIAKLLFKNSFSANYLDEAKIISNLKIIDSQKPQGLVNILRHYKRLIIQANAKEELQIETDEKLNANQEKELLKKTLAKKITYKINPQMVFGAKIKHGDWIFEQSLSNKLNQIV